jgi:hypothetical protein
MALFLIASIPELPLHSRGLASGGASRHLLPAPEFER